MSSPGPLYQKGVKSSAFNVEMFFLFSCKYNSFPKKGFAVGLILKVRVWNLEVANRPFYRYGGHIELIRFKEYYRMPRGHEHISFVFLSAFQDIFS